MVRGGDFYAIWDENKGLWSTDEMDALYLIDVELRKFAEENKAKYDNNIRVMYMQDSESGMVDSWHKYCQKQMRDSFHMLDEKLIFANSPVDKKDYASKRLTYPLEPGDCPSYEKLISTLYTPAERHKIEWAIGAIVTGDSKTIQKFLVMYGPAGTGKSTILNIIEQLFQGYYAVFDAKALGSANASFALEAFSSNPLVAIQHDGDLSKIEDNTRLNSLVSHELMTVNEKFKKAYSNSFKAFLFMGTNKPVKITDARSGLIRRLIDVTPSGDKLNPREYKKAVNHIKFELGAIASHCQEVYLSDPGAYDDYVPTAMMGASNDFYNFILDSYYVFRREDQTTLKAAWEMYKVYCEDAKITYPFSQRVFKEELKNYFRDFQEKVDYDDGSRVRSLYSGFRYDKFEEDKKEAIIEATKPKPSLLGLDAKESIFDKEYAGCPAQYATIKGTPSKKWDNVTGRLSEIDTSMLHYVKVPENHIVIDFDIPDDNGGKSLERNLEAASTWPPTYTELSKSGAGVHLHYIYSGDVSKLSRIYDDHIEVKVFTGNSSLRRKLTKCNDLPIATISSGLPLKGEDKMVNFDTVLNEKAIRTTIKRNLNKEYHSSTRCSIDFIDKVLNDAYENGMKYDVSDMKNAVFAFAAGSTNQAPYCIKLVNKMKFKSEEPSLPVEESDDTPIIFYDIEVFPNLFLVNWKVQGEGKPVVRLINPKPSDIEQLLRYRLIGFNNLSYDNHMIYACLMGYNNEQLYKLSGKLVNKDKAIQRKAKFSEAYNLSYTDVYDFAATKQSLKKWEIELGIHHQELGLPWDEPVPEERWVEVAEYCDNDVIATEAVFNHLQGDFTARRILADLAGLTVNHSTNTLTGKIIFGNNRKPQGAFCWRNMAEPVHELDEERVKFLKEAAPEMMAVTHGPAKSLLPYFPGYKFENGKSIYKGIEAGEGGLVITNPGMWFNVALLDVMSMHPHSAIMETLFGVEFTRRFREIVYGRVHIKHEAWDEVNNILDGKLTPYIQKVIDGEMSSKDLATALKIAINSVYGLTAASFETLFRDPRNKDNIVAKRGALFMIDLKEFVESKGFVVAHIKTDSIKIPNATPEIIQEVMDFGKRYGYTFEHEATYDRMCLVNKAVYIAKYADAESCERLYGYIPGDNKKKSGKWTATGTQFQIPYVFKTLFSKEDIIFEDMCEVKEVKGSAIYLDMNETLPDVSSYEKELKQLRKDDIQHSRQQTLVDLIEEGHDRHFVGRIGNFCPVKPGCGGGELVKSMKDNFGNTKYDSVNGANGYRWLEAEMIRTLGLEANIDKSYYNKLVDDAVDTISKYGDFEHFVSEESLIPDFPVVDDSDLPWYTDRLPPDDGDLFNKR
jgi:predicted DNA-binding protein YlxM (UPF0122 family)